MPSCWSLFGLPFGWITVLKFMWRALRYNARNIRPASSFNLKNKIEGTPILKLAMGLSKIRQKKLCQKLCQINIHHKIRQKICQKNGKKKSSKKFVIKFVKNILQKNSSKKFVKKFAKIIRQINSSKKLSNKFLFTFSLLQPWTSKKNWKTIFKNKSILSNLFF